MNYINKDNEPDYWLIGKYNIIYIYIKFNANYSNISFKILDKAYTREYIFKIFKNNITILLKLLLDAINRYI